MLYVVTPGVMLHIVSKGIMCSHWWAWRSPDRLLLGYLLLFLRAVLWALFLLSPGPGHHPSVIPRSVPYPEVYWFLVEKLKLAHD